MMREAQRWLAVVVSVAVVALVATVRADDKANAAGTWKGSVVRPDGQTTEFTLKLKQEGSKLTGVYIGGPNNQETALSDVQLKEDELSFQVTREFNENKIVLKYKGKLSKDGELAEFKPGILRILKETPVPVIPLAVSNLWGSMFSRHSKALWQRLPRRYLAKITLAVGDPVSPEAVDLAGLRSRVLALRTKK